MRRSILMILFAALSWSVISQAWMQYLPDTKRQQDLTFFDYQDAFHGWCRDKGVDNEGYFVNDQGERQKAAGWKQFRRWETEMEMMGNYDPKTGEFLHYRGTNERIKEAFRNQGVITDNISGNWVNLGYDDNPGSTGGYFGIGRINTIAFHPTDPDRFWVGAPRGGIWATQDGGLSWTPLSDFIGHIGVSSIGIPPDFDVSNTIYIGTGDRGHWSDGGIGILKSTDGGATWQETCRTFDFGEHYIGRILIDPDDPLKQFACSSIGIYRTTNGWLTDAFVPNIWAIDMEMHPTDHDTLYASTRKMYGNSKVLRSLNGGVTWDTVLSRPGVRTEIAVSPDEPDWIYAIVANDDDGLEGIYRSTDAGNTFTQVFDGMIAFHNLLGYDCYGIDYGGQAGYDLAIAVNPQDANDIWIGGINVWRSTDGGYNWGITHHWSVMCNGTAQGVHADQHCFAFQNESQVLFICNDGELLRSEYGFFGPGPFMDRSDGLIINQIYKLSNSQQDWDEIIMGLQDNSTVLWTDGDYDYFASGDGTDVLINPDDDDIQYYCGNSSYPHGTLDHWGLFVFTFSVSGDASSDWFKCFRCDPSSSNIVYYGLHKLWKSTNYGYDFSLLWDPQDTTVIKQMAVAPSDPNVIYFSNKENLYKTTDGGSSWVPLTSSLPAGVTVEYLTEIIIKEDDPNTIWMSVSGWGDTHVIKSSNGGSSWTDISLGLPSAPIADIIQDASFTNYPILYAGGFWGVYVKLGDQPWVPFNTNLPNLTVSDLDIYHAGGKIRAATFGRGFWESDLYSAEAGMPGIWTGQYNTDWNDYRNWQYMGVPDINSDVIIPVTCVRNPHIYTGNATCKNIIVEAGKSLNISGYELTVTGDAGFGGGLRMHISNSKLTVQGDISWEAGSSFALTGTNASLNVAGDWTFQPQSSVDLTGTEVRFFGSISSNLVIHSDSCTFGQFKVDKTAPSSVYYSPTSTANMMVDSNFLITSTGKFYQQCDKLLTVTGNLDAQGSFFQQDGTYKCINGGTIFMTSVGYFNVLQINHSTSTILLSDIEVRDELYLISGLLNISTHKLDLGGDLRKLLTGNIEMTSGKMVIMGNSEQMIYSDIFLANVEINNSDTLRVITGVDVVIGSLDWTDGAVSLDVVSSLTINELADDGIWGAYEVSPGATLNISNPTGSVDLNGKLHISGGTVNVHGGNHASYWPGSANAELIMNSGTLDFKDRGIYIQTHPTFTFTANVTGGTIRTSGGFQGDHTGFNPTGGTIEIYGTNNGDLGHGPGSNFYKLIVNKDASAPQVNVMSNMDINNDLVITAGDLDINGYTVDVAGLLDITGKLTMINAASILNIGSSVTWKPGSSSYILEGIITFGANWSFLDGTSAMLAGNNTVKVLGNSLTNIEHLDNDARFKHLLIQKAGSFFTILDGDGNYPLRVDGNLTVKSPNTLRIGSEDLRVAGTLLAESGSTLTLYSGGSIDATHLRLKNTMNLENGIVLTGDLITVDGSLNLTDGGTVVFDDLNLYGTLDINAGSFLLHNSYYQSAASHLILDGGSFKLDKPYSGSLYGFGGVTDLNGGVFEISHEGVYIGATSVVNFNGTNMRIGGDFQATFASTFQPATGTVEFINAVGSVINCANGNYFNRLIINKNSGSGASSLADDLTVQEDLVLQSGELQTLNNTLTAHGDLLIGPDGMLAGGSSEIYVGGNWTNQRGTTGFDEGTSSVTFFSPQPAAITPETFYNLDVDKALATGQYLSMPNYSTMTVLNKLTLGDGVLLLGENSTLNVNGNLHIKSGGGLNTNPLSTNTVINLMGHWWDYNTLTTSDQGFTPGISTVNLIGTANQEITAYGGVSFYVLNIQNPGNSIVPSNNVIVEDDFTILSGTWSPSASGLTFTFNGDFTIPDASNWQDAVNTVMFAGTGQQTLTNTAGGWLDFGTVRVDRPALAESGPFNINTHLSCFDKLRVESGEVIFDEYRLYCVDSLVILSGGELSMLNGSNLFMGDAGDIYLNGGTLNIWAAANNRSAVTHMGSGHFSFLVENGGVIDATYTDFEYMGQRGMNMEGTGLFGGVQPLNHCAFRNGEAGSALMTIHTTQEVTLYNVDFPPNTWSGTYNVVKEAASGNVIMHNAGGSFGGPFFEYDPGGLVQWPSTGVWEGDYSAEWHERLNWRFDYQFPDGGTDVVIPAGAPNYPVVSLGDAVIRSLDMDPGTSLIVNQYGVNVSEYSDISGYLELAGTNTLLASDSLVWQPGSSAYMAADARIDLTGNMFIRHGSDLNLNAGTIYFIGNGESKLICHDTAQVFALYNYKNSPYSLSLVGDTLARLTIKGYFRNGPNATLRCPSSQEWMFMSALVNIDNGHFRCDNGAFTLKGNSGSLFKINSGDYFNTLVIQTPSKVSLYGVGTADTLRVKGNLVIRPPSTSGITANAFKILVWGSWVNDVGPAAFAAGTSRVIFQEPATHHNILGNTIFYDVVAGTAENSEVNFYDLNTIDHNLESYFSTNVYGSLYANTVFTDNDFADLNLFDASYMEIGTLDQGGPVHVMGGMLTVNDLAEDYVTGSYTLDGAGVIDLGQVYSITATHDLYFADITINNGFMGFTGGNGQSLWPRTPGTASLTMTGGTFDMKNQEVFITPGNFTENISGGTIRTFWGFGADPACTTFHPTGGTVELYGTEDCSFSLPEPACWFYNLHLNKTEGGGAYPSSNMRVKNEFRMKSGYMETDGHLITVGP